MRYYCRRCHHPMKTAGKDGMGPVCYAKAGKPIPAHERDLFGYSVAKAAEAAAARVLVHVQQLAIEAHVAVRREFAAARRRLGIWSAA
jgi:cytochrome c2